MSAETTLRPAPAALGTKDAAIYLGLGEQTLRGWRNRGEGPAYVKVSYNKVTYKVADLDRWMDEHTIGGAR